jgi:hypothetical protein
MRRPTEESDAWLTDESVPTEGAAPERQGWQPLPPLPKWPPLPEESLLGGMAVSDAAMASRDAVDGQGTPTYSPQEPLAGWQIGNRARRRTFLQRSWKRYWAASRRVQVSSAGAIGVALVLCILLGSAVLRSAFHSRAPHTGSGAHAGIGTAAASTVLPTASVISPSAAPSPVTTATTAPFTITFTCASAVGGKGMVCVHTRPSAIVGLSVRYCDGSVAKGLQGTAHADSNGDYTWTWEVHTACASATATVTAKATGRSVTQSVNLSITS